MIHRCVKFNHTTNIYITCCKHRQPGAHAIGSLALMPSAAWRACHRQPGAHAIGSLAHKFYTTNWQRVLLYGFDSNNKYLSETCCGKGTHNRYYDCFSCESSSSNNNYSKLFCCLVASMPSAAWRACHRQPGTQTLCNKIYTEFCCMDLILITNIWLKLVVGNTRTTDIMIALVVRVVVPTTIIVSCFVVWLLTCHR